MRMKNWILSLSVPKILAVLCLLGLGANGLAQVGLQKSIAAKAERLSTQVAQAQQLSGGMKDGLAGLNELKETTVHMEGTLQELQSATSDMDAGLGRLDQIVGGIDKSVQTIGNSTQQSVAQIQLSEKAAAQLLQFLQKISQINSNMISNLNTMMEDQKKVNSNLEDLNRKTNILPRLGGN